MAAPPPRPISDAELKVLKVLWDLGEGTVGDVRGGLATRKPPRAYTTVQTLLYRLQEKGYVTSAKQGRALVFRPCVSREDHLSEALDQLADRVCEGSATPLMMTLMRGRRVSSRELAELRGMLDDLESRAPEASRATRRRQGRD
jgi:predicted transcriptional regulator